MKYIFKYFHKENFYTHSATIKNFPEAKFIDDFSMPDLVESDIKYNPHWTGKWREVRINLLTIIWYRFIFKNDWRNQIEYELTGKYGYGDFIESPNAD